MYNKKNKGKGSFKNIKINHINNLKILDSAKENNK